MKRDLSIVGPKTRHLLGVYANTKVKFDLLQIDNEFQIKFPFQVREKLDNVTGTLTFYVEIPETATFIRDTEYAESEVYLASLFVWLDKGIDVSHVRLVRDEETGEEKAIASKHNFNVSNPYEPGNWSATIAADHQAKLPLVISRIMQRVLRV